MKKLLIISQHFPPEIGAASNRINQMVNQFQRQGVNVYVITTEPSYPNPKLYKKKLTSDQRNNVQYHLYRSPVISAPLNEKILRLLNQLLFVFFAIFMSTYIVIKHSINICLTSSPPFLVSLVGLYCKIILKRVWILEVRDLWPDSIAAVGAINKSSFLFQLLKKLELLFYKVSNQIVIVTYRTKDILINQGVSPNKIHIVTNGIPDWISINNQQKNTKKNEFIVSYIGNIGLSQNLNILVDVANKLKEYNNIQFYIIGEGLAKKKLIENVIRKNLDNITFLDGTTNKKKLIHYYEKTDIGIVSLNDSSLFENVIPSKIFEYAACGTNILFLGSGEAAELIERYCLGLSTNLNAESIADIIIELSKVDKFDIDEQKRSAFLELYSWEQLIKRYMKVIPFEEKI